MGKQSNTFLLALALGGAALWYFSKKKEEEEENKKSSSIPSGNGDFDYELGGCTDPDAFNYNPLATEDNGSCIDKVYGCMVQGNANYNPDANIDTNLLLVILQ